MWGSVKGQTPNWAWARIATPSIGYATWGEGMAIATDNFENIYEAGAYMDTITFGSY